MIRKVIRLVCPYCNNEMESGMIVISATGSVPCAIIEWYSEYKCKKGIFGISKKSKVNIKDRKNGHFCSHYCSHCCKAFCEFETKKNGIALNLVF